MQVIVGSPRPNPRRYLPHIGHCRNVYGSLPSTSKPVGGGILHIRDLIKAPQFLYVELCIYIYISLSLIPIMAAEQGPKASPNYQSEGMGSYLDSGIPEVDVRASFPTGLY
jgi:hypothetical protein